jgi:hypothetical protein
LLLKSPGIARGFFVPAAALGREDIPGDKTELRQRLAAFPEPMCSLCNSILAGTAYSPRIGFWESVLAHSGAVEVGASTLREFEDEKDCDRFDRHGGFYRIGHCG